MSSPSALQSAAVANTAISSSAAAAADSSHEIDRLRLALNQQPAELHALLLHDLLQRPAEQTAVIPKDAVDAPLRAVELDGDGLVLTFSPLSASEPDPVRIPFDSGRRRPRTASDISLALSTLRSSARAALLTDVPSSPRLPAFVPPPLFPELFIILVLLAFQLATALASATSPLPFLVRLALFRDGGYLPGGRTTIRYSYVFLVVAHGLEALWFDRKLARNGTVSASDRHKWVLWTVAFGLAPMRPHYLRSLERERIRLLYARAADQGLALGSAGEAAGNKKTR